LVFGINGTGKELESAGREWNTAMCSLVYIHGAAEGDDGHGRGEVSRL
jgi:hypothetical protein